jgi:protoheme ferro-lyase
LLEVETRSSKNALAERFLDRGGRSETVRMEISCGKSEGELSWPHEESGASAWLRPATPALAQNVGEKRKKKTFAVFPV